jgi:pimeloyl-ACP methyl ester carboxylesterase
MRRGYVDTSKGQVHYQEIGTGDAVLLIHQVARSGAIYERLARLLSTQYRVICMDMPGFGGSDPLPEPFEISDLVGAAAALMDGLGIRRYRVSGHHTGATLAVELAVTHPERVVAVAPTGYFYLTREEQAGAADFENLKGRHKTPVSEELASDGSHLLRFFARAVSLLWQSQQSRGRTGVLMLPFEDLPPGDLAFVNDFVVDGLRALPYARITHDAVARYDNDARLPLVRVPMLVVQSSGPLEPAVFQRVHLIQKLVPGCRVATIENGDIHMIHSRAEDLSRVLLEFFASN